MKVTSGGQGHSMVVRLRCTCGLGSRSVLKNPELTLSLTQYHMPARTAPYCAPAPASPAPSPRGAAALSPALSPALTLNPFLLDRDPLDGCTGAAKQSLAEPEIKKWPVAMSFLFPALGGMLFGYDIGATSFVVVQLESSSYSGVSW